MLEDLYKREMYGLKLAERIETEGSIAVSIANRWALGWPERVADLLKDKQRYLVNLLSQTDRELDVLAEAVNMNHLSHSEIMQMHGVQEFPPTEKEAFYPLPTFVTVEGIRTPEQQAKWAAARERQVL